MDKDRPIEVYQTDGTYLSHCTRKRAAQMVSRQKARWIGRDQVELLITNQEEREIRKRVLERDGRTCYLCEREVVARTGEFLSNDLTYDHVVPRNVGGTDHEDNLAICCRECNEDKADRTPEQYVLYLYAKAKLTLGGYTIGK